MDADWMIPAFVVIDTLMEHLGHRSEVRGAGPRLRDADDCRRRRHGLWQPSRAGRADHARVRLSVGADQRLALPSSPPSARRWDDLDSGGGGGGGHHGRRVHDR